MTLATLRSLLFHCAFSPVHEVKRPSQALCQPLGLIGCSPSRFEDLQALKTCSTGLYIFYKLEQDSHTQCVHCLPFHIHTVCILALLCVHATAEMLTADLPVLSLVTIATTMTHVGRNSYIAVIFYTRVFSMERACKQRFAKIKAKDYIAKAVPGQVLRTPGGWGCQNFQTIGT